MGGASSGLEVVRVVVFDLVVGEGDLFVVFVVGGGGGGIFHGEVRNQRVLG